MVKILIKYKNMINLNVYTLNELNIWKNYFEKLRSEILYKKEKLWENYTYSNLNLEEQDEATIIFKDEQIIAFSFLYHRSFWQNTARTLNRFWISPKYRKQKWTINHQMTQELGISICDIMFDKQINFANNKNYDFVFVSREYPAFAWQKNFVKKNTDWNCNFDSLWHVANGKQKSCWQHCVWKKLSNKKLFPLNSMTLHEFKHNFLGK